MVLAKSKASVGLGNSLMNDRFGKGKGADRKKGSGVTRINHATGEEVRPIPTVFEYCSFRSLLPSLTLALALAVHHER